MLILIKGAGDLASGIALRLHHARFDIVMTDLPVPTAVRRTVAFSEAIRFGSTTVEDTTAERADSRRRRFPPLPGSEQGAGNRRQPPRCSAAGSSASFSSFFLSVFLSAEPFSPVPLRLLRPADKPIVPAGNDQLFRDPGDPLRRVRK